MAHLSFIIDLPGVAAKDDVPMLTSLTILTPIVIPAIYALVKERGLCGKEKDASRIM